MKPDKKAIEVALLKHLAALAVDLAPSPNEYLALHGARERDALTRAYRSVAMKLAKQLAARAERQAGKLLPEGGSK
jgi:hypothetical protein